MSVVCMFSALFGTPGQRRARRGGSVRRGCSRSQPPRAALRARNAAGHGEPQGFAERPWRRAPWAVVRAPGRVSGRVYDTPVGVQRVGDELYISLPYGEGTQWLRNVRAAGGATVLHDGHEIEATTPELVPVGETPMAAGDRLAIAIFGGKHALRLHAASSAHVSAP